MSPNSLIIFGFTGDLSKRKLMPALYDLELAGVLSDEFKIIGVTRRAIDMEEFKVQLDKDIVDAKGKCDLGVLGRLCDRISLADADIGKAEDYPKLRDRINELLSESCETKIFYFAVPPSLFEAVINNVVESGIHECGNNVASRLLIEKPFGHSLESAQKLLDTISQNFGPESIYPIDHYLAKDTVQNLLYVRFHNPIFRSIWAGGNVKSIQVSAMEELDIQGRTTFYEETGALRDMIQGHLMQLLALATMDEPDSLDADDVRDKRNALLSSIELIDVSDLPAISARGQYEGYREQVDNPESTTETFAALKLGIDSDRWRDVPIYLRAGKSMSAKSTEVNVVFCSDEDETEDNVVTFRIQPSEGIAISLLSKKPGLQNETEKINLDYCYHNSDSQLASAYTRILHDALMGDQTLFPTDKEILTSWEIVQPLLDAWANNEEGLEIYEQGVRNTRAADMLIGESGTWVHHDSWVCTIHDSH